MNKLECFLMVVLTSAAARAERGVSVDVNGFLDSAIETVVSGGSKLVIAAVILTSVGLMIPGFREVTRRSLPWTVLGILGIVLVTKYWH